MQKLIVYLLFGGWALLVGMSGLFGHFESGLLNLFFIVLGFGPISLVMYFSLRSKAKNSAGRSGMLVGGCAAAGGAVGLGDAQRMSAMAAPTLMAIFSWRFLSMGACFF